MSIAIPSGNQSVIQEQLSSAIQGPLQERSTFLSLPGLNIINTSVPLRIPRTAATSPAAAFTAPGVLIADNDVAIDEVDLLPSERTSLKSLTKVSNELIRQSALSLEAVLTNRIVEDQSVVLDAALWNGAGTSNAITGVLKATGITKTVDEDLLTDLDVMIDNLAAIQETHVTPSVLVMRPSTFAALRKIKIGTTDARYVSDPSAAFAAGVPQMFGLPVVTTTAVPASSVAVLDTSRIFVARDGDAVVTPLTETFGDYDAIAIRCVTRYDVALTTPKAVTLLSVS